MAVYPVIIEKLIEVGLSPALAVVVFVALLVWALVWKGMALWKSAKLSHRGWFIAILILQTFGILEIIYLYVFSNKRKR